MTINPDMHQQILDIILKTLTKVYADETQALDIYLEAGGDINQALVALSASADEKEDEIQKQVIIYSIGVIVKEAVKKGAISYDSKLSEPSSN